MDKVDMKFIYTQENLLKTIKEHSKNAKTIKFYCSNFESYHSNMNGFEKQFIEHLLYLAKKN